MNYARATWQIDQEMKEMINPGDFRILVVEDSAVQAEILRRILAEQGYQVSVAENGSKALEQIRETRPSLVISDVMMPIMDGYKMCQEIKHDDRLKNIPVILLTDLSDPKDVIKGVISEADNYVTKPYNAKLLLSRIESLLTNPPQVDYTIQTDPLELTYGRESYLLTSRPRQILNLLISTYENAVHQRQELVEAQNNLVSVNDELETMLRELRESEHRFSVLVQMIPDIVYRIDSQGRFTFVNNAVRGLGLEPEDLIGKHFSEIVLPTDIESVSSEYVLPKYRGKITGPEGAPKLFDERRTGERATRNLEVRLIRKQRGDIRPAEMESIGTDFISVEVNSSGMYEVIPGTADTQLVGSMAVALDHQRAAGSIGTVGAIRDITDRKLAEAALLRSEERFRLLVQTAGNVIMLLSPDNLILEWNHEAEIVFGQDRDAVLGKDFLNLFTPEAQNLTMAAGLRDVLSGKTVRDLEAWVTSPDAGTFRMLWNMNLLSNKDDRPVALVIVGQDVTEWKKAEEDRLKAMADAELSRVSAKTALETMDGMKDAVVITSPDGKILQSNKSFAESYGLYSQAVGTFIGDYVVEGEENLRDRLRKCSLDNPYIDNLECVVMGKDRTVIPVLVNATFLTASQYEPARIIAVLRDISVIKKYERDLQQRNKELEALYRISSAIAGTTEIGELYGNLVDTIQGLPLLVAFKVVALFTVEGELMELVPHPSHSQEFAGNHRGMTVGQCLCGCVAHKGTMLVCRDGRSDQRHTYTCQVSESHGHIILPLRFGKETKGVLCLSSPSGFEMNQRIEYTLLAIAGEIGLAIANVRLQEKTKALSLEDPLTGIANRRLLDLILEKTIARADRFGEELSVIMADIDHFKLYNDTFGHQEGDKVLCQVASILSEETRKTDLVVRFGGEEFLVLLPDADLNQAKNKAESIRLSIETKSSVCASLGVASYQSGLTTKDSLILRADQALYEAKRGGRNRVCASDVDDGT